MRRLDKQTVFLAAVAVATVSAVVCLVGFTGMGRRAISQAAGAKWRSSPVRGKRALGYLESLCAIGPGPTASDGMARQQKLLTEHFDGLGGRVSLQSFDASSARRNSRDPVDMTVEWHPERRVPAVVWNRKRSEGVLISL